MQEWIYSEDNYVSMASKVPLSTLNVAALTQDVNKLKVKTHIASISCELNIT